MKNANKIKVIIENIETKADKFGNRYHVTRVVNTANGKGFMTKSYGMSNVRSILQSAFGDWRGFYIVERSTGSARLSSLPATENNFNGCHYKEDWKKALQSIGFRGLLPIK